MTERIRNLIRLEQERGAELGATAEHELWFREQVQAALNKARAPAPEFHLLDEMAVQVRKRARRLVSEGLA